MSSKENKAGKKVTKKKPRTKETAKVNTKSYWSSKLKKECVEEILRKEAHINTIGELKAKANKDLQAANAVIKAQKRELVTVKHYELDKGQKIGLLESEVVDERRNVKNANLKLEYYKDKVAQMTLFQRIFTFKRTLNKM